VIALDPGTITMIQGVGFLDLGTQFVSDTMDANVVEIRKLKNKFSGLEIHHVIHDNNMGADVLSKLGSDRSGVPP
jgi:cobyric acid synthase